MRICITGHSNLSPESVPAVADALRAALTDVGKPLTGVSCLARGADQVFARIVLELGGELHVVLPAADDRARKVKPDNRAAFDDLVDRAEKVQVLPFGISSRDAYAAANDAVLSDIDALFAVWMGCRRTAREAPARPCNSPVSAAHRSPSCGLTVQNEPNADFRAARSAQPPPSGSTPDHRLVHL